MRNGLFQFLIILILVCSCAGTDNGIDAQMDKVLSEVEESAGYVNTYDDATISKMAAWFEKHGNDSQKARALFCLGRNQYNSNSYSAAIVSYARALGYAETASDTLSIARICYDMAHTYNASGNTADVILHLARAAEAFKADGRQSEAQQALLEIGQAQAALGRHDAAEDIFKSVLYDSHELKDTLLEVRCLESYAALTMSKDTLDPTLAIDLLSRAANDLGFPLSCSDKGILAYAYSLAGNAGESQKWLSEAQASSESDDDRAGVDFREYQISSHNGDSKKALASLEKVLEYGNRTQTKTLEEAVATSQREYISEQAAAQAEKLRSARLKLWVVALGALLILAIVLAAFISNKAEERRRLEEEKADTEKYMSIAEDLQARLSASQKDIPPGKHLPVSKFDALERLCEQYYIYEGTENLHPKILKEVKSIVEGLRSDAKTQKRVEETLDRNCDEVMTKLRAEFPSWKEEDFLLYSFAAAGFSRTTISTLMEKDKSVIYNRLWRLKGRIANSATSYKDFFLERLEG